MEALNLIGEYTWGLIPYAWREPLWWTFLVLGVLSLSFWFVKMPKAFPENIRGYDAWNPARSVGLAFSNNGKTLRSFTAHEVAESNFRALKVIFLTSLVLLLFPLLRSFSSFVFEPTPEIRETSLDVKVKVGQVITASNRIYTCTNVLEGKQEVPRFVRERKSSLIDHGSTVEEVINRKVTSTPTWWGEVRSIHLSKYSYICMSK